MSKIIGINNFIHDTGVSLIIDGQVMCALEEEKMVGVKSCYEFWREPTKCLEYIENVYGVTLENCDYVTMSLPRNQKFFMEKFKLWNKLFSYSHHKCHALGSYFTSGMDGKVMAISLDGRGNRSRGKVYLCENGKYEQVHSHSIALSSSLAGLWGIITTSLGWTTFKDEGKVVGLAGHGKFNQRIYDLLKKCFHYTDDLLFGPINTDNMYEFIFEKNLRKEGFFDLKENRDDLAFNLQLITEEEIVKYLTDLHKLYPDYKKITLSGGLFTNVQLNQVINELDFFEEIYVHPAMGDAGLALASAILKANELGEIVRPFKFDNAFLGQNFSREEWESELNNYDNILIEEFDYTKIGNLINDGNVVGLFIGKTEYGPRALGARSIVVKPTDKETHKKLNEKLHRTEIMPFAPSVLEDYSDSIFDTHKSKHTAEFMTLCYNTKPHWLDRIPAVVHEVDGTARPQLVYKNTNEIYYNIIDSYRQISGIPLVLNTSFNAHGEPINNYPYQVMKHLFDNCVDYIITEDFIISLK